MIADRRPFTLLFLTFPFARWLFVTHVALTSMFLPPALFILHRKEKDALSFLAEFLRDLLGMCFFSCALKFPV